VLLIEKNAFASDNRLIKSVTGEKMKDEDFRIRKVKKTMERLMGVVREREFVRKLYRQKLENEYIENKRQEEISKLEGKN
jgi:hypothetical protein